MFCNSYVFLQIIPIFWFRISIRLTNWFCNPGCIFVFEHLHVVYSYSYANESLENLFFWIQLALQSEGFAFIALSYMLKNRSGSTSTSTTANNGLLPDAYKIFFSPHNWINSSIKIREIIVSVLPMILISIPLMVTISALFVQPILNETEIKDMSLYTTLFDIVVLGYIFVTSRFRIALARAVFVNN